MRLPQLFFTFLFSQLCAQCSGKGGVEIAGLVPAVIGPVKVTDAHLRCQGLHRSAAVVIADPDVNFRRIRIFQMDTAVDCLPEQFFRFIVCGDKNIDIRIFIPADLWQRTAAHAHHVFIHNQRFRKTEDFHCQQNQICNDGEYARFNGNGKEYTPAEIDNSTDRTDQKKNP